MKDYSAADSVLKTMLWQLGFEVSVEIVEEADGPCACISSPDSQIIIGKAGDRLEDLQYLMNRIVSIKHPELPKVKVDCDGYRKAQEALLLENVMSLAEKVREEGKPARTRPLNAYYRRIVHNAFTDVEDMVTSSPEENTRYKRVKIEQVEAGQ